MSNLKKFNDKSYIHFVVSKTFGKLEVDKDVNKHYRGYPYFKNEKCCQILIEEFKFYRKKLGFKILGYVIMPDHIHMLIWWDLDEKPELTIGKIMQGIKGHSARMIIDYYQQAVKRQQWLPPTQIALSFHTPETVRRQPLLPSTHGRDDNKPHQRKLKYKIWQEDYYDFNIFTLQKYQEKLNYIHNNPVKAGLVEKPEDYKWSSYRSLYCGGDEILKVDQIES
jgi:REP element-mobilizing transposase RayT